MEKRMSDTDIDRQAERMLEAALGGMAPHVALLVASRYDSADAAARDLRHMREVQWLVKLLAALEKSLG